MQCNACVCVHPVCSFDQVLGQNKMQCKLCKLYMHFDFYSILPHHFTRLYFCCCQSLSVLGPDQDLSASKQFDSRTTLQRCV